MCGEHLRLGFVLPHRPGSSPHVRGARGVMVLTLGTEGIIPACAGSTGRWRDEKRNVRDHPRMCGEHRIVPAIRISPTGSSPHVRGARGGKEESPWLQGIIPACAGSTFNSTPLLLPQWDHPRMCGEHCTSRGVIRGSLGSSPHVRGARVAAECGQRPSGIIPACAGSTLAFPECHVTVGDHPRMCGEHTSKIA